MTDSVSASPNKDTASQLVHINERECRDGKRQKEGKKEVRYLIQATVKPANMWGIRHERLRLLSCAGQRKRGFKRRGE